MSSTKGLYPLATFRMVEAPMNNHFKDSFYYLSRAGHHARLGLRETKAGVERRVRKLTGREVEPESRFDRLRTDATNRARTAVTTARSAVAKRRSGEQAVEQH